MIFTRYLLLLLCVALLLALASQRGFLLNSPSSSSVRGSRFLLQEKSASQNNNASRPVMYTFYNSIDSTNKPAGMHYEAHEELVSVWKQAWNDAGWETKVLSLEDAKKHPDYESLYTVIQTLPTGDYNKLCFLRWIAMAAVGGGWMSDYDVLPLHDFTKETDKNLPFDGSLTVHDGMCPSMVSGSAHEWLRMAKRLIEFADKKKIDSDQKTLVALKRHLGETIYHSKRSVLEGFLSQQHLNWDDSGTCSLLTPSTMRGAHFAHSNFGKAKEKGVLPADFDMDKRPQVAKEWLNTWLTKCGRREYVDTSK